METYCSIYWTEFGLLECLFLKLACSSCSFNVNLQCILCKQAICSHSDMFTRIRGLTSMRWKYVQSVMKHRWIRVKIGRANFRISPTTNNFDQICTSIYYLHSQSGEIFHLSRSQNTINIVCWMSHLGHLFDTVISTYIWPSESPRSSWVHMMQNSRQREQAGRR